MERDWSGNARRLSQADRAEKVRNLARGIRERATTVGL